MDHSLAIEVAYLKGRIEALGDIFRQFVNDSSKMGILENAYAEMKAELLRLREFRHKTENERHATEYTIRRMDTIEKRFDTEAREAQKFRWKMMGGLGVVIFASQILIRMVWK